VLIRKPADIKPSEITSRQDFLNRRDFMQQTGVGLAGAAAVSWAASSRAAAANERLRVGLIGCGGRGRYDAAVFASRKDVEIAYIADPHKHRLAEAAKEFRTAIATDDFRRILDDKAVDAVINATPVHWHAPATILACEAGKHVYVEKPCSHNLREGRLMVEAARRNKRRKSFISCSQPSSPTRSADEK